MRQTRAEETVLNVKSKDWKGKRAETTKKKEDLWKQTENGSTSHLGWAGGLMNYLIAYRPPTRRPFALLCPSCTE